MLGIDHSLATGFLEFCPREYIFPFLFFFFVSDTMNFSFFSFDLFIVLMVIPMWEKCLY